MAFFPLSEPVGIKTNCSEQHRNLLYQCSNNIKLAHSSFLPYIIWIFPGLRNPTSLKLRTGSSHESKLLSNIILRVSHAMLSIIFRKLTKCCPSTRLAQNRFLRNRWTLRTTFGIRRNKMNYYTNSRKGLAIFKIWPTKKYAAFLSQINFFA